MIEARGLTKRYGDDVAVDDLTCTVRPGTVTGFLGPNGAGKSTTLRLVLGLDRPTSGSVTVAGRAYRDLVAPMREVGALLDAGAVDGRRSARDHLRWLARAGGLLRARVDEVLDQVGLADVAGQQVDGFSLGMSQRLGIAAALLGDPPVLLLDEPVNGLDPEGIRWIRTLLRGLADEGRTVLVSSHLMAEVEATADRVLVIGRGRLLADETVAGFTGRGSGTTVRVVTPEPDRLRTALEGSGQEVVVAAEPDGALAVSGTDNVRIAEVARDADVLLHELTPRRAGLEATFLELTEPSVRHRAAPADHPLVQPIGGTR